MPSQKRQINAATGKAQIRSDTGKAIFGVDTTPCGCVSCDIVCLACAPSLLHAKTLLVTISGAGSACGCLTGGASGISTTGTPNGTFVVPFVSASSTLCTWRVDNLSGPSTSIYPGATCTGSPCITTKMFIEITRTSSNIWQIIVAANEGVCGPSGSSYNYFVGQTAADSACPSPFTMSNVATTCFGASGYGPTVTPGGSATISFNGCG